MRTNFTQIYKFPKSNLIMRKTYAVTHGATFAQTRLTTK